ncbi:MAG: phosphorylase [Pseudonocardiales bacterium]|nr:MAG: phosphorylase [Pseudonocardiales bacterium]
MRVGIISGSGSYQWPGLDDAVPQRLPTCYGTVEATTGTVAGVDVVHVSRHGAGHLRLSNHVQHKANLAALRDAGVAVVVSLTLCGALDPAIEAGSVIAFDDLYFPGNRLPDGTPCTWYDTPGEAGRGHWIFDRPMSEPLRRALLDAAHTVRVPMVDGGCYGHVEGPRFNSRAEIAALRAVGVSAVSQTAGPEVVLAGEAELPLAVLGFVTDHATGVLPAPVPVGRLVELMQASTQIFAAVVNAALPAITDPPAPGFVYRFES